MATDLHSASGIIQGASRNYQLVTSFGTTGILSGDTICTVAQWAPTANTYYLGAELTILTSGAGVSSTQAQLVAGMPRDRTTGDDFTTFSDQTALDADQVLDIIPGNLGGTLEGVELGRSNIPSTGFNASQTLTVTLEGLGAGAFQTTMASDGPAFDTDWDGFLRIYFWLEGPNLGTNSYIIVNTTTSPLITYTSKSVIANGDTGRVGPTNRGRLRRCPITGEAVHEDTMVPDGYRRGTLVAPENWDPEEPQPRALHRPRSERRG